MPSLSAEGSAVYGALKGLAIDLYAQSLDPGSRGILTGSDQLLPRAHERRERRERLALGDRRGR